MKTAIILLLATLAFAISPLLNPEFGGFDPNRYPVPQNDPPVQPAGYAFAIWGPIYLWLIVSAVFGLWKRRDDPAWVPMRLPLSVSLVVGAAWLPVALVAPVSATVMIWVMLLSGLVALNRAPQSDRPWAQAPIGLYAGWLTAASFVALGLLFAGYGWMSETQAAVVCLVGALALAALVTQLRAVPSYGVAVVWALIAVAVQNWGAAWGLVALSVVGAIAIATLTARPLLQK